MKYKIITLLLLAMIISCGGDDVDTGDGPASDNLSEIAYKESNEVISNPERGFKHHWAVNSEGNPLNVVTLKSLKNENVTIILRLYYLEAFKNSPLSAAQLDLMKTDFERLREAGIKCVLRFAYNSNQNDTDAPLNIIETHLDQMKPLFTDNADIIAFVQAGFIGSWGEWYYTTNDLTTLANRKAVVNKLLEAFPKEIKIQLRTPIHKQEHFGTSIPMSPEIGYGTTDVARVGFHNDCFLASDTDYGTYQNVTEEKNYISKEAFFVPTGGETCPPSGVPTASCATAENEMALLKWTYLNLDYFGPVLQVWRSNNCFEDFQRKLGYRLVLKSSILKNSVTNDNFNLDMFIDNVGYAPVYNMKNTSLVFKSVADGTLHKVALDFDVRKVIPTATYKLNESVNTSDIPAGKYKLYLQIEDGSEKLSDRPEFSIQLANKDTWDADKGLNDLLHTLTIN